MYGGELGFGFGEHGGDRGQMGDCVGGRVPVKVEADGTVDRSGGQPGGLV